VRIDQGLFSFRRAVGEMRHVKMALPMAETPPKRYGALARQPGQDGLVEGSGLPRLSRDFRGHAIVVRLACVPGSMLLARISSLPASGAVRGGAAGDQADDLPEDLSTVDNACVGPAARYQGHFPTCRRITKGCRRRSGWRTNIYRRFHGMGGAFFFLFARRTACTAGCLFASLLKQTTDRRRCRPEISNLCSSETSDDPGRAHHGVGPEMRLGFAVAPSSAEKSAKTWRTSRQKCRNRQTDAAKRRSLDRAECLEH